MRALAAVAILWASPAWGAYSYYLTDNLTTVDSSKWNTGGALISRVPAPDGSNEGEVRMTVALAASGGTYTAFLQATPDASTSQAGAGSYLAFEMQNPVMGAGGACSATFVLLQRQGGITTLLGSFVHSCRNGMVLRLAVRGNTAMVWPDEPNPSEFQIAPGVGGAPGVGTSGVPTGNRITQVQLGAISRTAPAAIQAGALKTAAYPRRVDLQWTAVTPAANGADLAGYWIYRDGSYFGQSDGTTFTDETVTPSSSHTYTVQAIDQHHNLSQAVSAAVRVPASPESTPAAPFDPAHPPRPVRLGAAAARSHAARACGRMGLIGVRQGNRWTSSRGI